jgi:hypothetical protein
MENNTGERKKWNKEKKGTRKKKKKKKGYSLRHV